MSKCNLILADPDEWYIDSLGKYISSNYGAKFNVNVYTRQTVLEAFLTDNSGKGDILLTSPEFLSDDVINAVVEVKIVLTGNKPVNSIGDYPCIFKYQSGDKLVSDLISLCSNMNSGMELLVRGNKQTRIVPVLSPQGGSGKTTIAVSLAYQLGKLGLEVFYLNLESIASTSYYMRSLESEHGMNEVLYHLKQNKRSIPVVIDRARSHDSRLNIDFFASAGCSMELDELSDADMEKLLSGLKGLGRYDFVIVDTQAGFNRYSIPVLCSSDAVVTVIMPDMTVEHKLMLFDKELDRIAAGAGCSAHNRLIPVINRRSPHDFTDSIYLNGRNVDIKIPYLDDIFELQREGSIFNPDSSISGYIKKAAQYLAQKLPLNGEGK